MVFGEGQSIPLGKGFEKVQIWKGRHSKICTAVIKEMFSTQKTTLPKSFEAKRPSLIFCQDFSANSRKSRFEPQPKTMKVPVTHCEAVCVHLRNRVHPYTSKGLKRSAGIFVGQTGGAAVSTPGFTLLQYLRPLSSWSGSAFGSAVQNTPASGLQCRNVVE